MTKIQEKYLPKKVQEKVYYKSTKKQEKTARKNQKKKEKIKQGGNMEELDLKELFGIFWAKRIQIVLIVLIFMVIGVIYTVGFTTPKYSAETTLILASQNNNQTKFKYNNNNNINRINSKLKIQYQHIVN